MTITYTLEDEYQFTLRIWWLCVLTGLHVASIVGGDMSRLFLGVGTRAGGHISADAEQPERPRHKQGNAGDNSDPRQCTPTSELPSHIRPHCIYREADVGKVAEHEHSEQRFVDDLLRPGVLCEVAAGGIDDGEVDEGHQKARIGKLEDRHVRLGTQLPVCSVRSDPWGLGVKRLGQVSVSPLTRQSHGVPFTYLSRMGEGPNARYDAQKRFIDGEREVIRPRKRVQGHGR